jgi:hypothetical protein
LYGKGGNLYTLCPLENYFIVYCGLYHKVLAKVANQAHNLEVGGSSPPLVTKWEKDMIKILNALNLRQLVRQANELKLTNKEIITVQQSQGQFYLVYYNKE